MKRINLLITALCLSITGIVALFFLQPDVSPNYLQLDAEVKRFSGDEVTFLTIVPKNFTVVSFKKLDLPVGNYTLVGRLQEYKGKVEFVVEKINTQN